MISLGSALMQIGFEAQKFYKNTVGLLKITRRALTLAPNANSQPYFWSAAAANTLHHLNGMLGTSLRQKAIALENAMQANRPPDVRIRAKSFSAALGEFSSRILTILLYAA